ncbi:uncharacterized protein LOC143028231 [Oratosquilla oratoria]|uniref:uncharacterized protein LOC143028231 n=1 Tax=Oratosquilla oratoria TaxID=337810 RepID=UPI003F75C3AD
MVALIRGLLLALVLSVVAVTSVRRWRPGLPRNIYDDRVHLNPCSDPRKLEFSQKFCLPKPCQSYDLCPGRTHKECSGERYCCHTGDGRQWACAKLYDGISPS